jgi:hypothetical protein
MLPQINLGYERDCEEQDGTSRPVSPPRGSSTCPSRAAQITDFLSLQLQQSVFRWEQWVALRQADSTIAQAEADYQTQSRPAATRRTALFRRALRP